MRLPAPANQYDAANEAQTRSAIEREDARNLKKGGNVLIGKGALVLTAPNGSLWQITVSNGGAISYAAVINPLLGGGSNLRSKIGEGTSHCRLRPPSSRCAEQQVPIPDRSRCGYGRIKQVRFVEAAVAGPLPEATRAAALVSSALPQGEGRVQWARCKHWIESALPYCYGTHTIEDVERQIAEGRLQFWPGERCAAVTEIVDYPQLRALNFFLVGGELKELIEQMEPTIVAWAKALGCTRVAQTGRKGWGRVLAPLGYHTTLSVMIRDLD